jgi:hypothetical protein
MNLDLRSHCVSLVADDEILSDADAFMIKCVEADCEATGHVSRDSRRVPQRYFGWMPMRVAQVIELWEDLEDRDMSELAPPTIGGRHFVVWENTSC